MAKPKILCIIGPTASGKSDLAVHIARKFNGEILSADSRQVYKGLDVGTGKITKEEMRGVPHHLLDVADPEKRFSASDYQKLGTETLKDIVSRGRLPIVAGGTGFYIDTLTCAVNFPEVPPNKLLRTKLEKLSKENLFEMLEKKDPVRAGEVDPHNKVRLIRALEIVEALGKVPKQKKENPPYEFIYIGLNPPKEVLEERIRTRLKKRMPGMIREAKELHKQGLTYKRMEELGLEYKHLALYLRGKLDEEEMVEKLHIAIRQYARRQMTWFKRNEKIRWFETGEEKKIEKYLEKKL